MKITRFTQSCLFVEEAKARILIDPSGVESDNLEKFGALDAVLYTHEHSDHFDPVLTKKFLRRKVRVYANESTARLIKGRIEQVVEDRGVITLKWVEIRVIELPHCPMPDGSSGPQNTGYLINGTLFHPGDGKELSGLQVDNLAVPITGPDVSMRDAFDFLKQVGAKTGIPIHYDKLGANAEVYKTFAGYFDFPFELKPLANGESLEI